MNRHTERGRFANWWHPIVGNRLLMRFNNPILEPAYYYLFSLMGHALSDQRFSSFKNGKNASMNGSKQNGQLFSAQDPQITTKMGKIYS